MNEHYSVAVVGGGAAGMMAAASVKEFRPDAEIVLFEKNKHLGAKVLISGGGRCNVTAGIFEVSELLKNYPRGAKFLITAMYQFPPHEVMAWFEQRGVPLKVEDDLRVFPVSNNGRDVVGALEAELREKKVEVLMGTSVTNVEKTDKGFVLQVSDGGRFTADKLILTTGGNAYRHTGSTGDGYAFARALGHSITPLAPSLNSFILGEKWASQVAGVSFETAHFVLTSADGERRYERTGPFVFTHKGVSGPAIFALSSMSAYEACGLTQPLGLVIDFFPSEPVESLAQRFKKMIELHGKKTLLHLLDMFLPKSLCPVAMNQAGIDPAMHILTAHLQKNARDALCDQMKHFKVALVGRGSGEEFVSAGGVSLKEIDSRTMQSKICPGLYIAGELLDVDGFTGGFNLQASWATGRFAGKHAASAIL